MQTVVLACARRSFLFFVGLALLAGCAAPTQLNAQWFNPQYEGKPPFGKLLVLSVTADGTVRRVFEDLVVANLGARGVTALPSYRFLPADGPATQAQIESAVKSAGVDAVLTSRVISVSQTLQSSPGMAMWPGWGWGGPWAWGGYYGFYNGLWAGGYAAPQVWTEDSIVVDTQLFDAKAQAVVWSGSTTTTTAPGAQGTVPILQQFASLIVEAMAAAKLF